MVTSDQANSCFLFLISPRATCQIQKVGGNGKVRRDNLRKLTCSQTGAVRVADALFEFHGANFKEVRVDRRLARETEPSLNASEIRIVGQEPRCPCSDFFSFGTRVNITRRVLDTAAGTVGSTVLRRRVVAASQPRTETSAA
jgi:hypothetical protein